MTPSKREPWLRETYPELSVVPRAVIHALEMAGEDVSNACAGLTRDEWFLRPGHISSMAFQVRHIIGSVQRLLSYAEGRELSPEDMDWLHNESSPFGEPDDLLPMLQMTLMSAQMIAGELGRGDLEAERFVGRERIRTTLGGLLIHVAEHTSRHTGQVVTTGKLLRAVRAFEAQLPKT